METLKAVKEKYELQHYGQIFKSALGVGAISGSSGLVFGSVAGIIRSSHPVLFALASGTQWFALGSSFWASRGIILHFWGNETSKKRYVSGLSGAIAGGSVAALTRGRAHILPAAMFFGLGGLFSQIGFDIVDETSIRNAANHSTEKPSLMTRLAEKKWMPFKTLSDEEYAGMLRERLIKVEAQIAMLDEDIAKLRTEAEQGIGMVEEPKDDRGKSS